MRSVPIPRRRELRGPQRSPRVLAIVLGSAGAPRVRDRHARHRAAGKQSVVIDFRPILFVVGILLSTLGAAMLVPAFADAVWGNPDWRVFCAAAGFTVFVGGALYFAASGCYPFDADSPVGILRQHLNAKADGQYDFTRVNRFIDEILFHAKPGVIFLVPGVLRPAHHYEPVERVHAGRVIVFMKSGPAYFMPVIRGPSGNVAVCLTGP